MWEPKAETSVCSKGSFCYFFCSILESVWCQQITNMVKSGCEHRSCTHVLFKLSAFEGQPVRRKRALKGEGSKMPCFRESLNWLGVSLALVNEDYYCCRVLYFRFWFILLCFWCMILDILFFLLVFFSLVPVDMIVLIPFSCFLFLNCF